MKKLLDKIVREMAPLNHLTDESVVKGALADTRVQCARCTAAHCCSQATLIFLPEAFYIANKYPVPPELWAPWIVLGTTMEQSRRDDYFGQNISCVYLDNDKRCNIYDRRPSCCRVYFTACEPALCSPHHRESILVMNATNFHRQWAELMMVYNVGLGIVPQAVGALPRMMVIATKLLERPSQKYLHDQIWLDFDGPLATS